MRREKILNKISVQFNDARCLYLGIALVTVYFLNPVVCVYPVFADSVKVNKQVKTATAQLETSLESFQVDVVRKDAGDLLIQPSSDRQAQIDSSEVIGDTLGEINKLRQELLIDPISVETIRGVAAPASSAGTPTAYGARWGQAYVGIGGFFPFGDGDLDGSAAGGIGFGDPVKYVGVELNINMTSIGGQNFDIGDSGSLGFKVHRSFSDGTTIAFGWANPINWGDADDTENTFYGVVTRAFNLQPNNPNNKLPLTVSLGLGTGVFRSLGAIRADENPVNFFGSVGLRLLPQVSLISSWTGNRLNVGASFVPLRRTPLVINTIFTDVTDNLDRDTGLAITAGYVFQF